MSYLFSQVPLAPSCPSCARPLALEPWRFQDVGLVLVGDVPSVLSLCALCRTEVHVPVAVARPALRVGLGLVTPVEDLRVAAPDGAKDLDVTGGPRGFLNGLSLLRSTIGGLDSRRRSGLIISLDEMAEVEALEAEWRKAEEMAAIMDGELSEVPGFEDFRRGILDSAS